MNITNVGHMTSDADAGEDKMAKAAREQKKDPWQIAEFYTKAFFEDIRTLNIQPAHKYPRATEHIPEMIALIRETDRARPRVRRQRQRSTTMSRRSPLTAA